MKKQTTFVTAIVAILIAFMAIFTPASSFAGDPEPKKPKADKPCDPKTPNCPELLECRENLADALKLCPGGVLPKKQEDPKPKPQPFTLYCGYGTKGDGKPLSQQEKKFDSKTGGFHCVCAEEDDVRVTSISGSIGKYEFCLGDMKKKVEALELIVANNKKGNIDPKVLIQLGINVQEAIEKADAAEKKAEEAKKAADEAKDLANKVNRRFDNLKSSDVDIAGGLTGRLGTRGNEFLGEAGLVLSATGWFHPHVGITGKGIIGMAFEPNSSAFVSPFLSYEGMIGPSFAFDTDRQFVLSVGPWFRQMVRTSEAGNGFEGNFFGGAYGAELNLRLMPPKIPLAFTPKVNVGYGPTAGWFKGAPFQQDLVSVGVGLEITLVGGIKIGGSSK